MLSETMLGLLGFITIFAIVVLLFKKVMDPAVAFIVVPSVLAVILVACGYFSLDDLETVIKSGFSSVAPTAALFVFSILFFGIMSDAGMFDVIIGALVKRVGHSVIGIAVMTCIIALIGHLDGGGASTFLIVVPAMLPIYKRMGMRSTTLLTISVLAMGILNLMPWAGPTMRSASVMGVGAKELWRQMIPIQIVGIIAALGIAVILGIREKKRGAGLEKCTDAAEVQVGTGENELARPKLFLFNLILTLLVIVALVIAELPSYVPFMIGVCIALMVNYPGAKQHGSIIKKHAGPAIMMAATLFAAGFLMGILSGFTVGDKLDNNSVMFSMASMLARILPDFMGKHLPIVMGILSVPLALAFSTDAYFYGVLPVMLTVGNRFGIDPIQTAIAMCVCRNCATFISPMVPATLLGTGLAEVEIEEHINASFFWVWAFSFICMAAAILFGIIRL